jgi:N-acetylglucosaminylphosphatidylinositol deacetylase
MHPSSNGMEVTTTRSYVLVIAHPDDESMFFLPMIRNILHDEEKGRSSLHILCLSNGNYDNLGTIRERELHAAAASISRQIKVTIINSSNLPDGPNKIWPSELIGKILSGYINEEKIDNPVLVTFDEGGVSGHTNHVDTHRGVLDYYMNEKNHLNLELWTLNSIENFIKKYFPIITVLQLIFMWILSCGRSRHIRKNNSVEMDQITFMMIEPILVWRAMNAHYTQFVWYRRLFVIFSRYSYVNDFTVHRRKKIN